MVLVSLTSSILFSLSASMNSYTSSNNLSIIGSCVKSSSASIVSTGILLFQVIHFHAYRVTFEDIQLVY